MRIALERASVRFGNLAVTDEVTLAVESGDFVTIVGPSGCGKSTLLNAIAGLLDDVDSQMTGRIRVESDRPGRPRLAYVFQRDTLLPWATILANVETGMAIQGVPKAERARRAFDLMRTVGLEGFEGYYPHQVSGGMRQRTQLIRSLAYEPEAMLMDEPFGALDAQNRMLLQAELLRIWERRRMTTVFVTHDLAEAIVLGQRVVVMSRRPGRVKRVYDIPLPSPRDPFELRASPEF